MLRSTVVLLAVPLVTLAVVAGIQFRLSHQASVTEDLRKTALALGLQMELYVTAHERGLQVVAAALGGRPLEPVAAQARLDDAHVAFDGFLTMLAADERGELVARSLPPGSDAPAPTPVGDRPYFIEPMRTGKPFISDVFKGRGFGSDPIVAVSAPVAGPDGRPIGIVEGSLNLRRFAELAGRYVTDPRVAIVFTDQNDRVIFSNRPGDDFLASLAETRMARARIAAGQELAAFSFEDDATPAADDMAGSAYTSPRTGWHAYVARYVSDVHAPTRRFYLTTLALLLIGTLVAFVVARSLSARITRPLEELAARASALEDGASVVPAVSLDARAPSDIVRLVRDVDGIAGRVAQAKSELQTLAGALEHQVRLRTTELEQALVKAERASRAKSDFLANVSHELRTPMNGVLGMTQLLQRTSLDDEQRDCVETLESSGRSLLLLLNQIIDFARVESGRLSLEESPVDVLDLAEDVVMLAAAPAAQKRVSVHLDVHPDAGGVFNADGLRLRQVLGNLLSNAVRFTEQGHVGLEVRQAPAGGGTTPGIEFVVSDTGIGMTEEQLGRVFEPFEQGDASATRRFGGSGLGLAICDRLVRLMGGTLHATSGLGQGSTFVVRLPAGQRSVLSSALRDVRVDQLVHVGPMSPLDRAAIERWLAHWAVPFRSHDGLGPVGVGEYVLRSRSDGVIVVGGGPASDRPAQIGPPVRVSRLAEVFSRRGTAQAGAGQTDRTSDMAKRHPLCILVVEDTPVNQKIAAGMLRKLGYDAEVVEDGEQAVGRVAREDIDVVLMDLQMPNVDGLEAARRIRAEAGMRQPWIVALTANAFAETRQACHAAGMNDFIAKPLLLDELAASLEGAALGTSPRPLEAYTPSMFDE